MFKSKKIKFIVCFFVIFVSVIWGTNLVVKANINEVQIIRNNGDIMKGNGVSLGLPQGYMGGNPAENLEVLITKMEEINPIVSSRLKLIKQQDLKVINLLAFDSNIKGDNFVDNVNIVSQENKDNLSLEDYISQQDQSGILKDFTLEKITLKENQIAEKIIANFPLENTTLKQVYYILENNGKFYTVTYTTSAEKFNELLPVFEQSIQQLIINN